MLNFNLFPLQKAKDTSRFYFPHKSRLEVIAGPHLMQHINKLGSKHLTVKQPLLKVSHAKIKYKCYQQTKLTEIWFPLHCHANKMSYFTALTFSNHFTNQTKIVMKNNHQTLAKKKLFDERTNYYRPNFPMPFLYHNSKNSLKSKLSTAL